MECADSRSIPPFYLFGSVTLTVQAYAAETPAYTPANFNANYEPAATPGAQGAPTPGFSGSYNARTPGPNAATPGYAPASP